MAHAALPLLRGPVSDFPVRPVDLKVMRSGVAKPVLSLIKRLMKLLAI
jgi:hypothetical protein